MSDSRITHSFTEVRDTVDGKKDDYIAKLQVEMDKMRKENDLKIKQTREETEAFFSKKVLPFVFHLLLRFIVYIM